MRNILHLNYSILNKKSLSFSADPKYSGKTIRLNQNLSQNFKKKAHYATE